jgi:hypothetical protein
MVKKEITKAKEEVGSKCNARFDNIETMVGKIFAHFCFNVVKSCIVFATHFFFGFGDLPFDHTDDQQYQ